MLLAAIEATNFRNLSGRIEWGPRLNIIYGNNGQGKTNWLEAIYLLARTKSFRTQRLQEAIRFGEEIAVVRGKVTTGSELERDLQVSLHDNSKTIFVNSKRETLARYLTQLQVFSFTAADLDVVRGMPEARRRFLDRGISSPARAQSASPSVPASPRTLPADVILKSGKVIALDNASAIHQAIAITGDRIAAVGSDADLVIFDPDRNVTVTRELLHQNVDHTPYEGFSVTGWPAVTISCGEVVFDNGKVVGRPGRGRFVKRKASRRV